MSGPVPAMFWYVLVAVAIFATIGSITYGITLEHRRRLQALAVLRLYAERGQEPPKAVLDRLAEQILDAEKSPSLQQKRRGAFMQGFMGLLYSGCATAGIMWWLIEAEGPRWGVIAMACGTAFFALGALGMLSATVATILAQQK